MTHLTDAQMADAIEGRGDRIALSHIETCTACREQVEEFRALLHVVQQDPAPLPAEAPSAFATGVSARITALDRAGDGADGSGYGRWLALAATFIIAVGLAVAASYLASAPDTARELTALAEPYAPLETGAADGDEAWTAIQSLAEELDYDAVRDEGVAPAPGTLERAALELSNEERAALIRLIENEMKRTQS